MAGAEEDEMMADVAALAGGGDGGDALATLEGALRPIERYAVRLVEEARPRMWRVGLVTCVRRASKKEGMDIIMQDKL